jgi:hypothetical protein
LFGLYIPGVRKKAAIDVQDTSSQHCSEKIEIIEEPTTNELAKPKQTPDYILDILYSNLYSD